ncbi:nickel-dependent hydrogenase large subunit [Desulfosporosinus sp. PR]|uniref:hydrogenase large subunit n=1 Tax=Candidatus Desulfosporosinus nitrosoreducens TaxID=3401928 RepID=UPI0027EAD076|nr:nickel-dependent hydrogenase large subunit [Desulfosporosinus sp. PR]MDQ7092349.1 nickel-dependent hydrogenase large subunit [Desulfosporosinus sp. PR]
MATRAPLADHKVLETPHSLTLLSEKLHRFFTLPAGDSLEILHYVLLPGIKGREESQIVAVTGSPGMPFSWLISALPQGQSLPSLAPTRPVFLWPEREMHDRSGLPIKDHPDLRPLLFPEKVSLKGIAHGSGSFHLPLGPVRGDVGESLHYLFDLIGEQIMFLESQLFYKHRDLESLAVNRTPEEALVLAERVAGVSSVAHASAFVRAVEQAAGRTVSLRVEYERLLLGEMERLYNHARDLALLAGSTGMTVGQAQLARVQEELLRFNGDLTGSRYLRGTVKLGQSSSIPWPSLIPGIQARLEPIAQRLKKFTSLLAKTPTFTDRLKTTGRVEYAWIQAYDLVGPVARAAGLARDVRQDHFPALLDLGPWQIAVITEEPGDAFARFLVRVREWHQSYALLCYGLFKLADPNWGQEPVLWPSGTSPSGWGIGLSESPRGRTSHLIRLQDNGRIAFWHIHSASACNWPVFGLATSNGNIQTDFPIIEASFSLNAASCDR